MLFRSQTQHGGLELSIPDMKCYDDQGKLRVIVENKFGADLTKNQPVTYIHELQDGVAGLVLFVVPEARLQLVWGEIVTRCKAAEIPVDDVRKSTAMTVADIGGEHYIAATSWKVLLDALSAETPINEETDCRSDIAQLQGLCRRMDEEVFLPLSGDELTNLGMARRFINFADLALDIVNVAASQGLCDRDGVRETNYRHGSGARIRIGKYTPWVGFDAKSWLRLGISPIWVFFYPPPLNPTFEIRERLVKFRTGTAQPIYDSNNGLLVPIVLLAGVDKQHVIDHAVGQIRKLRNELGVGEPSTDSTSLDPESCETENLIPPDGPAMP